VIPQDPITTTRTSEESSWGSWFRDSSDKFLLLFAIMVVMGVTLHVLHHNGDSAQLQFMNGITSTLVGGFMTLVTGAVLRKSATTATSTTTPDPTNFNKPPVVRTEAVKIEEK
jgi:hypothetical protein